MIDTTYPYGSRCPIHGNIPFSERERQIINHPFCQRLRHILQLGFASYVYAGATHHRLAHSMGVMHLAGTILDHIVATEKSWMESIFEPQDFDYFKQIVRFAALLHDVGHPPFSHSLESSLPPKKQLPLPTNWYHSIDLDHRASHEDFTIAIIAALSQESPALLTPSEAQDICALIDSQVLPSAEWIQRYPMTKGSTKNILPLLHSLISGEIDADRMDYLHRDSYYAGVNYGRFDMERMVRSLGCTQTERGIVLTLEQSAIYTYEDYLLARYHMFMQVYFHKTLLPFDYYLKQTLLEKEIDLEITGSLDQYLGLQDHLVFTELWKARSQKWASRIVFRKTVKKLFQVEFYHREAVKDQLTQLLEQAKIDYLFLESSAYLSTFNPQEEKLKTPFLLKNIVLGKPIYRPVQRVSRLLDQYNPTLDIQFFYCDPADYSRACEVLSNLVH